MAKEADRQRDETFRRLVGLASTSPENYEQSKQEAKALIESSVFKCNEAYFWPQITASGFLEDCYYEARLSANLTENGILLLPEAGRDHLPRWAESRVNNDLASNAKSLYDGWISAKQKAQKAARKAEEAKQRKAADESRLQAEKIAKVKAERLAVEAEQAASIGRMTRTYSLSHIFGVLTAVLVMGDKDWIFFNWVVWLGSVGVYAAKIPAWFRKCFEKNFLEYETERLIGISANFRGKSNVCFDDHDAVLKYESIFSVVLFLVILIYSETGATRTLGVLGFFVFLFLRPVRRVTHYSSIGFVVGVGFFLGSSLIVGILVGIKHFVIG